MNKEIEELLNSAIELAVRYKKLTDKPLGITGEIAEFQAAKLLNLTLAEARQAGYDALDHNALKYQIKGRALPHDAKPGQRVGAIKLDHEWDVVVLVLMDDLYNVNEIWQAQRDAITHALLKPGSKARNERGSLAVSKFKQIGERVWSKS
ncbi:hypothetical protein ACM6VD_004088 [Vibrio vulnificus]